MILRIFILTMFCLELCSSSKVCIRNEIKTAKIGETWYETEGASYKKCYCSKNQFVGAERVCTWAGCVASAGVLQVTGSAWVEKHSINSAKSTCKCTNDKGVKPLPVCKWSHCFTQDHKPKNPGDKWIEKYPLTYTEKDCVCSRDTTRQCKYRPYCFIDKNTQYKLGEKWEDKLAGEKCECKLPIEDHFGPPTAYCVHYLGCPNSFMANVFDKLGTKMGNCVCSFGRTRDLNYGLQYYWKCDNPKTCILKNGERVTMGTEYFIGSGNLEQKCKCTDVNKDNPHILCTYIKGCYSFYHDLKHEDHDGYFKFGTTLKNGCICVKGTIITKPAYGVHYHWNCDNAVLPPKMNS